MTRCTGADRPTGNELTCPSTANVWVGGLPSPRDELTEWVAPLRQRLEAAGLHLGQLAQLADAGIRQALRDLGANACQLPRLQAAVCPEPLGQALGQQQCVEGLWSEVAYGRCSSILKGEEGSIVVHAQNKLLDQTCCKLWLKFAAAPPGPPPPLPLPSPSSSLPAARPWCSKYLTMALAMRRPTPTACSMSCLAS